MLSQPVFVPWVIDSTVMAVVVTGLTVLTASMAGYAFAKIPFAGSRQFG